MRKKEWVNIKTGRILNENDLIKLPKRMMLKNNPHMWEIWDFEENNKIGFDIYKASNGSGKKAYWYCDKCKLSNDQIIKNKVKGTGCPTCSGYKASDNYNLTITHPKIAEQWHPTKNGDLTPYEFGQGSDKRFWWLGDCGHEWESSISNRVRGRGCPYCNGKLVDKNINSISFTNPEIVKYLVDKEDGCKYTSGSDAKINWRCDCGAIMKKQINFVIKRGLCCGRCSDGRSFGEKLVFNLLMDNNINFEYDKTTTWSNGNRYDFVIYNQEDIYILEVQGEQHFDNGVKNRRGRSIEEEIENDRIKKECAMNNGVKKYYYAKSENQDIKLLVKELIDCEIVKDLNINILDEKSLLERSYKSLVLEVCKFYNENDDVTSDYMSKIFKVTGATIRKYLKKGYDIGLCDYTRENNKFKTNVVKKLSNKVVQLTPNGDFIGEFNSLREACRINGFGSSSNMSKCCKGISELYQGYKWMYKEDYEKLG